MKLLNLFKKSGKTEAAEKTGKFSEFFLRASDEDQKQIFTQVAQKANEEQREVLAESLLKTKDC